MTSTAKPLRIGVLYEETQMADLAGVDIIGNCSAKNVEMVSELMPTVLEPLKPFAIPMEFLYISSSLDPAWTTPEMYVRPTHTYATAPRDLDIILIGGPNPATVADESLVFLREAAKQTKTILTTCTGGMWLAKAGVLDGKKATTNRMLIGTAKQAFPKVEWLDQRWVIGEGHFEGAQIWTAGGAGCGELSSFPYKTIHSANHDQVLIWP
jgi:putative intracellular protease/amidase